MRHRSKGLRQRRRLILAQSVSVEQGSSPSSIAIAARWASEGKGLPRVCIGRNQIAWFARVPGAPSGTVTEAAANEFA
jgi:hypothetical protein